MADYTYNKTPGYFSEPQRMVTILEGIRDKFVKCVISVDGSTATLTTNADLTTTVFTLVTGLGLVHILLEVNS